MKRVKPPQLDIEPNIALAHAENWTREKLFAYEAREEGSVEPLPISESSSEALPRPRCAAKVVA